jgi:glycosyltransferase involved in cell wall biosynthesis
VAIKKILFLHQGSFWNRGSEKVLLCLLSNLDRDHFDPLLICNHKLLAAEAEKYGIRTLLNKWPEVMIDTGHVKLQFISVLKTIFWLKTLIKKESIEMVVCNSGLTTQSGYYAAKLCGIPSVSYIHSPYTKRYIYLYRLHKSNMAIFVSYAIKTAMNKKITFTNKIVIHNGIDIERFKPVAPRNRNIIKGLQIEDEIPVIGQIGSLINRKGVDLLIEAAKQLAQREIEFLVILAGSGVEEGKFKEMVKNYKLEKHIIFTGDTDSPDFFYQHIFDINVLASRSEAFGITLAEGAACGLPCVGSNTEGIPEVVRDQKTGLLFKPGNANDLADKLEILIKNPELRNRMGKEGRRFVVDNFSQSKTNEFNKALSGFS